MIPEKKEAEYMLEYGEEKDVFMSSEETKRDN